MVFSSKEGGVLRCSSSVLFFSVNAFSQKCLLAWQIVKHVFKMLTFLSALVPAVSVSQKDIRILITPFLLLFCLCVLGTFRFFYTSCIVDALSAL